MPEFRRPRHRAVRRVLESLNAKALARANCLFGAGTRIALELNEYRESENIDFIYCDITGYRSLRASIGEHSLGELMPKAKSGVSLLRNVRADQYGIRTILSVDGEPVKFEIILEARIQVAAATLKEISVPVLDHVSCFAEKWLANADHWNDKSVLSRDLIDLAFMQRFWGIEKAQEGARLAIGAYGEAVTRAAHNACAKLLEDAPYRRHCIESLAIDDNKILVAGLRSLTKIAKGFTEGVA